tara:strand:+ start:3245 stop:4288 length:1044 start_codon:yes stop_codon:yes gene_type:complete
MKFLPHKSVNIELVNELLQKNYITNQYTNYGPNTIFLESYIHKELEIKNSKCVILVNNGSSAIQILCSGISLFHSKDLKWVTQAFTFPSSVQGSLKDAKIVDIDYEGGLDLNYVKESDDGIIVTNFMGYLVNIQKYEEYCRNNNKFLIFDNAGTHFTYYKNQNALNYGVGSIISFHHTKPFGFGEGGAIICDKKYEKTIRELINFGFDETKSSWSPLGNNHKISEISSIYILQHLKTNKTYIQKHCFDLYKYFIIKTQYSKTFQTFPSFHSNVILPLTISVIFTNKNYCDCAMKLLCQNYIEAKKYYKPLKKLKVSEYIFERILCIPCHVQVTINDIDFIINLLFSI